MNRTKHLGLALAAAVTIVLGLAGGARAQGPVTSTGVHYYALENLDRNRIDRRGQTETMGVAFSRLILSSNTRYRLWVVQANGLRVGRVEFETGPPGTTTQIPEIILRPHNTIDDDEDGLPNLAEMIIGTDASNPDSDADGVPDGAEIAQGSDPADGIILGPGIRSSIALPGPAYDLAVDGELLVVAHDTGVSGFNIFAGLSPVQVFSFGGFGQARHITCSRGFALIGNAVGGVSILDVRDPSTPEIVRSIQTAELQGQSTRRLEAAGLRGFIATSSRWLFSVDLRTGEITDSMQFASNFGEIIDLVVDGDRLFVGFRDRVRSISLETLQLTVDGVLDATDGVSSNDARRLEVAGGRAYLMGVDRFRIGDVSDPAAGFALFPRDPMDTGIPGCCLWDLEVDSAGTALVARGTNSFNPVNSDIFLYDVSDPTFWNLDLGLPFPTPGGVRSIELANALAYLADNNAGVQILSYRDADLAGVPPTVLLDPQFDPAVGVTAGSEVVLSAIATDDIAVRDVRFEIGNQVITDASFPFEIRFTVPAVAGGTVTARALAFDTANNTAVSETILFQVLPDVAPPEVLGFIPSGSAIGEVEIWRPIFSEAMDPSTIDSGSVGVAEAGPDLVFDSADDAVIVAASVSFDDALLRANWSPATALGAGRYRMVVGPPASDTSGNLLAGSAFGYLAVYADTDVDNDGVLDGALDFDGDGLLNAYEALLGLDPLVADFDPTNDADDDGLTDALELALGLVPTNSDLDGDGFSDGEEIEDGTDPFDPTSFAMTFAFSSSTVAQSFYVTSFAASRTTVDQLSFFTDFAFNVLTAANAAYEIFTASSETSVENSTAPSAILRQAGANEAVSVENQSP